MGSDIEGIPILALEGIICTHMSLLAHGTSMHPSVQLTHIDQLNREAWELLRGGRGESLEKAEQALELALQGHYLKGEAEALRTIGAIHYTTGDFDQSFSTLSRGLELAREIGEKATARDCVNYSGAVYAALGELEKALEFIEKTYWLSIEMADQAGVCFSLNNMGNMFDQLGRFDDGLSAKLEALDIALSTQDHQREAIVQGNLINSYINLGRYDEAIQTAQAQIERAEKEDRPDILVRARVNMGEALGKQKRYSEALEVLEIADKEIRALGVREGEVHCALNIAMVHLAQNHAAPALPVLLEALETAESLGVRELASKIHLQLSKSYTILEDFAPALKHYQTFHQIEQALGAEQTERKLRVFGTQRELEKTKAEAEIERLRNVELKQALERLERADLEKSALLDALKVKTEQLEIQAVQDALTKLYNRRYLEQKLASEFERAQASSLPLSVVIIDVDNFKQINDRFSHQTGDVVLQNVAALMQKNARQASGNRPPDIVARYGGEEFVLVLPQANLEAAIQVCERVRKAIEAFNWSQFNPDLKVTISLGLCSDISHSNHEKMLDAADAKLYVAKRSGKNQVQY